MKFLEFLKKYQNHIIIGVILLLMVISAVVVICSFVESEAAAPFDTAEAETPEATESAEITETEDMTIVPETEKEPVNSLYYFENEYVPMEKRSNGIDVSKWQGKIDWRKVKESGIEFAFIRVGYRNEDGLIYKDEYCEYNLQQASKYGVKIGVYFFSTAISKAEAEEEADYVLDIISDYTITYPVVYDCEGYNATTSRMYEISATKRTDIALAYLDKISEAGYDAMHYGSRNDLMNPLLWQTYRIAQKYKIWVAFYSIVQYPEKDTPTYIGRFDAWQYTASGKVDGISTPVDRVVCYFRCDDENTGTTEILPDGFEDSNDYVTAKIETNLRTLPNTTDSMVVYTLKNGEYVKRLGVNDNTGWSVLDYNGRVVYAVTQFLVIKDS